MGFRSLIYSDKSFEHYNPDSLMIKKGNSVYKRMLADEQVKAVLNFKKAAVTARGYTFDINADDPEQERIADFFNHAIGQMAGSFSEKLKYLLSGLQNGYSISEKVYKSIDWDGSPYWGLDDIKLKPWDTFTFLVDKYGGTDGLMQSHGYGGNETTVPLEKVIHWVYQPDIDRWYGESDLRAAYRAWWSKDITIRFQNIHLERHGSGIPIITPDENAGTSDNVKSKLLTILKNLTTRTGIVLPKHYKMEMQMPQRTDAYEKAVAQHDKSIAKAMMVPNLLGLSEQGQTGSYSQSQTQFDVFLWVMEDICNSISECLNEQLFAELALWNFGTAEFPLFKFDPMTEAQKLELAKAWSELVQKSAVENTDRDEAYTRSLLGWPEKEEVEGDEGETDDDSVLDPDGDQGDTEDSGLDPDEDSGADKDGDRQTGAVDEFTFTVSVGGPWLQRVRFKEMARSIDRGEADFAMDLAALMAQARLSLEKQVQKIAGQRSFGNIKAKEFEDIKLPKGVMAKLRRITRSKLKGIFEENYNRAALELPKKLNAAQIVGMDKTRADSFLASKSMKITDVLSTDVLKAVQQILENAIKYDKTLKDTMNAMETETALTSMLPETDAAGRAINVPARLENIARTNIADAVNQGRMSLFGRPEFKGFIRAYQYSSILDQRVSDVCEALDGKIRRDWGEHAPPNHFQCRSILVPVTAVDDWDGNEHTIPASVKPNQGFG